MAVDVTRGRFRLASPATANVVGIAGVALLLATVPLAASHALTVLDAATNTLIFLAFGGRASCWPGACRVTRWGGSC